MWLHCNTSFYLNPDDKGNRFVAVQPLHCTQSSSALHSNKLRFMIIFAYVLFVNYELHDFFQYVNTGGISSVF